LARLRSARLFARAVLDGFTRLGVEGVAVMMDARDALDVSALPVGVEWTDYVNSWKGYLEKDALA
jgi:hypothetical protein